MSSNTTTVYITYRPKTVITLEIDITREHAQRLLTLHDVVLDDCNISDIEFVKSIIAKSSSMQSISTSDKIQIVIEEVDDNDIIIYKNQ